MKRIDPFLPILGVFALLAVWQFAVWNNIVDPVLLPSPATAAKALWAGMGGALGFDFIQTVRRTVASIAIASVIAIPLGIFLGSSERLYRSVEFIIDFFRSTPASATRPRFRSRRSAPRW